MLLVELKEWFMHPGVGFMDYHQNTQIEWYNLQIATPSKMILQNYFVKYCHVVCKPMRLCLGGM